MSLFRSLFGTTDKVTNVSTPLDAVESAASLVSTPSAIDPLLDDVRRVTSKLQPGETPTHSENQVLLRVYLKLESYLINDDPIRSFNKNELRSRLNEELKNQIKLLERSTS